MYKLNEAKLIEEKWNKVGLLTRLPITASLLESKRLWNESEGAGQWLDCLAKLRTGNYEDNWPSHEIIRTGDPNYLSSFELTPTYNLPIWQGQEVDHLLVNADCGMGDAVQFFRFLNFNRKRCTLICPWELWSLFGGHGLEFLDKEHVKGIKADAIINIMALPKVLGVKTKDIHGRPYLQTKPIPNSDATQIANKIKDMTFTKIGLCLSGNPFNPRTSKRDILLDKADLFNLGVPIFNFNKLEKSEKVSFLPLKDWNHTAMFLELMDYLITVDTCVAHVAGALGVKTYLLLKDNDEWRWGSDGSSTCWYDSVEILRGSEESLMDQVKTLIIK